MMSAMNRTAPSTASTMSKIFEVDYYLYQTLILVWAIFKLRNDTDMSLPDDVIPTEY